MKFNTVLRNDWKSLFKGNLVRIQLKQLDNLISSLVRKNSKRADGHPRYFESGQSPRHTVVLRWKRKRWEFCKQYGVNNAFYFFLKHLSGPES